MNDPFVRKTLFSSVSPSNILISVSDRELFELTQCPSRALDSPRVLLPELQRNKVTVNRTALGSEVPGHHPEQLT